MVHESCSHSHLTCIDFYANNAVPNGFCNRSFCNYSTGPNAAPWSCSDRLTIVTDRLARCAPPEAAAWRTWLTPDGPPQRRTPSNALQHRAWVLSSADLLCESTVTMHGVGSGLRRRVLTLMLATSAMFAFDLGEPTDASSAGPFVLDDIPFLDPAGTMQVHEKGLHPSAKATDEGSLLFRHRSEHPDSSSNWLPYYQYETKRHPHVVVLAGIGVQSYEAAPQNDQPNITTITFVVKDQAGTVNLTSSAVICVRHELGCVARAANGTSRPWRSTLRERIVEPVLVPLLSVDGLSVTFMTVPAVLNEVYDHVQLEIYQGHCDKLDSTRTKRLESLVSNGHEDARYKFASTALVLADAIAVAVARCRRLVASASLLSLINVADDTCADEVSWELTCDGLATSITGNVSYSATHALSLSSCNLQLWDSYGDGWQGAVWTAPDWTDQNFTLASGYSSVVSFVASSPSVLPSIINSAAELHALLATNQAAVVAYLTPGTHLLHTTFVVRDGNNSGGDPRVQEVSLGSTA